MGVGTFLVGNLVQVVFCCGRLVAVVVDLGGLVDVCSVEAVFELVNLVAATLAAVGVA